METDPPLESLPDDELRRHRSALVAQWNDAFDAGNLCALAPFVSMSALGALGAMADRGKRRLRGLLGLSVAPDPAEERFSRIRAHAARCQERIETIDRILRGRLGAALGPTG
jgi:hypothetical protein